MYLPAEHGYKQEIKNSYAHGVGCWKSILSNLEVFKSIVRFEVRNKAIVLFWHDMWCGDQPLTIQFPNLFRMECLRDARVHDVLSWNGS